MLVRCVPVLLAAALLVAACGSQDAPPPRSPLDETATAAATGSADAAATATATATAGSSATPPSPTPASAQGDPTPPLGLALEVFTGTAIELMAEWLGLPATDLSVAEAEALIWRDACLGVDRPGIACPQAEPTPGFRIVLRDAFDGLHTIHAAAAAGALWVGASTIGGTITALEGSAITVAADDGGELTMLAVPGSLIAGPRAQIGPGQLEMGRPVRAGYDASPTGGELPVLAWLSVE